MATLILIIFAAALFWAAGVYLFPFRNCRHCGGTGRKTRRLNRRHFDLCNRCAGTGAVHRPGARLVHRATLTARTQLARQRQQRRQSKTNDCAAPLPRTGHRTRS
jgi:hypothetical protein